MKPLSIGLALACEATGLGRSKLLELAYAGVIISYKCGTRRLFPVESLEQWVRDQVEASSGATPFDPFHADKPTARPESATNRIENHPI
jgi:excisionase family DNA binding protein